MDSKEDKQSESTNEEDSTTSTMESSSFVSEAKMNNLQKTLILDIKDHLDFNVSTSLLSHLKGQVSGHNIKRASICNYLGHGAEIKYTELQGGQEEVIMAIPDKEPENSSEEEHEDDSYVPWKRHSLEKNFVFTGFEEAATDDVHELTKVITSHNLYIDVIGKPQLIQVIYQNQLEGFEWALLFQTFSQSRFSFQEQVDVKLFILLLRLIKKSTPSP